MKRIIGILLSVFIVTGLMASPAFAIQDDVKVVYTNELEWLKKINNYNPEDIFGYQIEYCVYDIDKDGIKELLVKMGTCEADYIIRVYGCEYGKIVSLATLDGGHTYPYECDTNGIFMYWSHMGCETLMRVSKHGHDLVSETVFSNDLNPLFEKGVEDPWHQPKKPIVLCAAYDYSELK